VFRSRVDNVGYDQQLAEDVTLYHPARNVLKTLVSKDRYVGRRLGRLQRCHPDRYGTPGVPPRPTRIKRPRRTLPVRNRLAFGTLSAFLTDMRGLSYYREYAGGHRVNEPTDDETPGFGALVAFVALIGAALLAARRQN